MRVRSAVAGERGDPPAVRLIRRTQHEHASDADATTRTVSPGRTRRSRTRPDAGRAAPGTATEAPRSRAPSPRPGCRAAAGRRPAASPSRAAPPCFRAGNQRGHGRCLADDARDGDVAGLADHEHVVAAFGELPRLGVRVPDQRARRVDDLEPRAAARADLAGTPWAGKNTVALSGTSSSDLTDSAPCPASSASASGPPASSP